MKLLRQKVFARKKGKKAEDYLREAVEEAKENLKKDPNNWKNKFEYESLTEPIVKKRANIPQKSAIWKKRSDERGGISFHNQYKFDSTGHIVGKGKQIRWNERDPLDKKELDSIDNLIRYEHGRYGDRDARAKVKEINEHRKDELRSRLSSKSLKEVETRKKLADKAKKLQKAKKAVLIGVPVAAAAIGTGVAIKKHHDKKKKEQEQE